MKKAGLVPGAVFEVATPRGVGYVQYLGRHPEYVEAVRVAPRIHRCSKSIDESEFSGGVITFYTLRAAVAQGLVKAVGVHATVPMPNVWRRPGARSGREIETWIIESPDGEILRKTLSGSEASLPVASIWTHGALVQHITGEVDERAPREPSDLQAGTSEVGPGAFVHYMYFDGEAGARAGASAAVAGGFVARVQLGGDGDKWLVLVGRGLDGEREAADVDSRVLKEICQRLNGEYDGWEVRSDG